MDFLLFSSIAAAVLAVLAGIAFYITKANTDHGQKSLKLYLDWTERFDLPALSADRKKARDNSKILANAIKIVWNKKKLEELYLRHDIPNLTQEDALTFVLQADQLFLASKNGRRKKGDEGRGFIYDIHDAREGNLHLIAVEKSSHLYRDFVYGQALINALRDITPLNEFPEIALEEEAVDGDLVNMHSFVIAKSNMSLDPQVINAITASLTSRFGDAWQALLIADDVIKFQRAEPEELAPAPVVKEMSPFAKRQEAKRLQAAEAQAALQAAEEARKAKWAEAEQQKRQAEVERRRQAIAAGLLSPLAERPHDFLAQTLEIAVDASELFAVDDEFEIVKTDNIGTPTAFTAYTSELVDVASPQFQSFVSSVVRAVSEGFGGSWTYSTDSTPASSITFQRAIV